MNLSDKEFMSLSGQMSDRDVKIAALENKVKRRRGDCPWIAPRRLTKYLSTTERMSFKSVTFAAWQRNIHHSTTRH